MITKYRSEIKNKAKQLRKEGNSLRDISEKLGLPLGTVHLWTKEIQLNLDQQKHLEQRRAERLKCGQQKKLRENRNIRLKLIGNWRENGRSMVGTLTVRERFLVGAALYWSEGFKKDLRLGLANSDPNMIIFFLKWLVEEMGVPKKDIRLRLGVNESYKSKVNEIEKVWSELIDMPLEQFQKPFFQKVKWQKSYPDDKGYMGVLRVRANDQIELFWKIKGMVEGLRMG